MKTQSLKALIADHGVSFDASTIMNALIQSGHAEVFEYSSTTSNGLIKSFKRLTAQGEIFGLNKASMGHPFRTESRFFTSQFPHLLDVVTTQLRKEVEALKTA